MNNSNTNNKAQSHSDEWMIYDPQQNKKNALDLAEAIAKKDTERMMGIFRDMKALRSLIIWRGENGECLESILLGFETIVAKEGNLEISRDSGKGIIDFLVGSKIPEEVLFFCGNAAYHLRNRGELDVFSNIISDNKEILHDTKLYFRSLHDLASWKEVVDHDSEESIRLNMEVVANTKEFDPVYYVKAKFGLTYNRTLTPRQKVADFLGFAEDFKKYGDMHDCFRATVEAARAMLDLARQQGIDDIAFENLEESKKIALESLKMSKDIGYLNLEIVASEVLGAIYSERLKKLDEMGKKIENTKNISKEYKKRYRLMMKIFKGDTAKSNSFKKMTEGLREVYGYDTRFSNQYKETYFKHVR